MARDHASAAIVPLFNPRVDRWEEHYQWSAADPGLLEGPTPCGRATLVLVQMNHPTVLDIRRLLASLRLFL